MKRHNECLGKMAEVVFPQPCQCRGDGAIIALHSRAAGILLEGLTLDLWRPGRPVSGVGPALFGRERLGGLRYRAPH